MSTDGASQRVEEAANLASLVEADHSWDVYAQLLSFKELSTRTNQPYFLLELGDLDTVMTAKIWSNQAAAMATVKKLEQQAPVKVRGRVTKFDGKLQLEIDRIRQVDPANDDRFDPDQLVDPALQLVEDLVCKTMVIDIETVPAVERRQLPPTVSEALSKHATRKDLEPAAVMGMSPFFGKVVSIAIGDGDADPSEDDVTTLAVAPEGCALQDPPSWLRLMSERDLLRSFWALAGKAEVIVTFNGRRFDVPFLVTRSLVHGLPARRDLMSKRWSLKPHLDLWELLTPQGSGGPSKLDVVCWALEIESPKEVMDGSMVAPAYEQGDILKIAEYNRHDVRATAAVYRKVRDSVLRFRRDWN